MTNTTEILNDLVAPSRINRLGTEFQTEKKRYPNGRLARKKMRTNPIVTLDLEFDGLTLVQYEQLRAFFHARFGSFGSFRVRDSHTATLYTVVFADDVLSRENVRPNVRGLYKVQVRVETV